MSKGAIYLKSEEQIAAIKRNGDILGRAQAEVAKLIEPGVSTDKLDIVAEEYIRDNGGVPSFKGYNGFPYTLCISVNDVVVHGFPSSKILQEGDIISVDCGVYKDNVHADSAYTYPVGEIDEDTTQLLKITKESLFKGIEAAKAGNRVGDISAAVQTYTESFGYGVVRELVGHGVGQNLHEAPEVPNYGKRGNGPVLKDGMVIAIEPMINMGKKEVSQDDDNWTIRTIDGKFSAHFEHTVLVKGKEAELLTTFKYIEEVQKQKNLIIS